MSIYMPMSTTGRHTDIVQEIIANFIPLKRKNEIFIRHEQNPLVYYGRRFEPSMLNLVNVNAIEDTKKFLDDVIMSLNYVCPDIMIFCKNRYLENEKRTRIVGQPDLIIEIWSESNTKEDRDFLKYLYSTSPLTEHWYIEQDRDVVECWYGDKQLNDQYISEIMKTKDNIEIDLRYLALKEN